MPTLWSLAGSWGGGKAMMTPCPAYISPPAVSCSPARGTAQSSCGSKHIYIPACASEHAQPPIHLPGSVQHAHTYSLCCAHTPYKDAHALGSSTRCPALTQVTMTWKGVTMGYRFQFLPGPTLPCANLHSKSSCRLCIY